MLKAVKGFEAFCASDKKGLCIINVPTGVGKTYQAIDHIANDILSDSHRRIIFITPMNKNVDSAYADIAKRLLELNGYSKEIKPDSNDPAVIKIIEKFTERVIILKSYEEHFKRVFDSKMLERIAKSDFCSEHLRQVFNAIEHIKQCCLDDTRTEDLVLWRGQFAKEEFLLRQDIKKWIKITKRQNQKEQSFLSEHSWIKDLYPSTRASTAQVLLMSMDKFLSIDDPLFSKSMPLFQQGYVKGSLVFIDEFDTTKEWVLRKQIEESSKNYIDLTKTHFQIQSVLTSHYPYPSFGQDDLAPNSPRVLIPALKNELLILSGKYHLDYTIKTDDSSLNSGIYLFDDGRDIKIVTKKKGYVSFELDTENRNQLRLKVSNKKIEGTQDFIPTVNALVRFRNKCILSAVKMCRWFYDQNIKHGKTYTVSNAVSSIMDPFNDEQLRNCVMNDYALPQRRHTTFDAGSEFYYQGFRYISLDDKEDAELTSSLNMVELRETPEKFLVSLCERAMVVGMSATADVDTVTGNYDLSFIKNQLSDHYYQLSIDEKNELTEICRKRIGEGNNGAIVCPIKCPESDEDIPAAVFECLANQEDLGLLLFNSGAEKYKKQRFIRILLAIKEFVRSDGHVLLIMSTDIPKNDSLLYSQSNIEKMVAYLNKEAGKDGSHVKVITLAGAGSQYDRSLKQYRDSVNEHRIILLTSYQSTGTGQNLQYEQLLDDLRRQEVDIDSIYLEKPTNVTVDISKAFRHELSNEVKNENLVRCLYQAEAMACHHDISIIDANKFITTVFARRINGSSDPNGLLNGTRSAKNHMIKILIQAVGRICRVSHTNNNGFSLQKRIYVDSSILALDFSCTKGMFLNPEFESLVKAAESITINDDDDWSINVGINHSIELSSWIYSVIGRFDDESMRIWKEIREYVLKHPTINKEDLRPDFEILYMENRGGCYYTDGNEKEPSISWEKDSSHPIEISEATSRLSELMMVNDLKDAFIEKGYATAFLEADRILNPVAFQSIYLGALGEACGRALLEHDGIILDEIDNKDSFEIFDYVVHDNPSLFVDFKHWKPSSRANLEHNSIDFKNKLNKVNGSAAYVINLLADGFEPHSDKPIHFFPSILVKENNVVKRNAKQIFILESMIEEETNDDNHE